jgi:hypothetical protein
MAIRSYPWMDGFDYYATDRLTYKWASASNIHVSPTGGRRNSGCIVPTGAGYLVSQPFEIETYPEPETLLWQSGNQIGIGFAIYRQSLEPFHLLIANDTSATVFEVEFTCSGRIGYRIAGETWQYTDGAVPFGEWFHFSMLLGSNGPDLWLNAVDNRGQIIIQDYLLLSDLGWSFAEEYTFSIIRIEAAVCGHWRIDDLYVINSTDPKTNPGDTRIDVMEMVSDEESSEYAEWTLSSGSTFAGVVSQRPEDATANSVNAAFACYPNGLPHEPGYVRSLQVNAWVEKLGGAGFNLTAGIEESTAISADAAAETGYSHSWTAIDNQGMTELAAIINTLPYGVKCSD